jgi:ppGpp synthetase/RelA/SpoT-type nucleotidyltranferase
MANDIKSVVEKYRSLRPIYEGFAVKLTPLLRDILLANDIKFQIVESRAKDISSFEEKITRPGKAYDDPLKDITDLCGSRIIVYYQDDVDRVAEVIKKEFVISEENLSRQPQLLDVDRFGYLSAHYIVSIAKGRTSLTEWKPYAGLLTEIQVRTVIQHAWSAVSHALQYKQETAIPSKLQRRLHRIAGLFELADEEFVGLRKERAALRLEARQEIEKGNERVPLSAAAIVEFLESWKGVKRLLSAAEGIGFSTDGDEQGGHIVSIYDAAVLAGINDLEGLRNAVEEAGVTYLEALWSQNKERGSSGWSVTGPFLVLLILIYNARERVKPDFLIARGFDKSIANLVVDVARQSGGRKVAKKS